MAYRVELSKSNRAGCSSVECKKENVKITKGDLRQGVMVTIKDQQSWKFRHWGCVTPKVLANWAETCEMDMELVDGYDELPEAAQEKVKRALEQGHVDDADWNGDIECNRPGAKGMFLKTPKKTAENDGDDGENESSPTKKAASKKRAKSEQAADDPDGLEPPAKKTKGKRGKKAAAEAEEPEPENSPKPANKKAAAKKGKTALADEEIPEPAPAAPAKKGKATKGKKAATDDLVEEEQLEEAPAAKKAGRGKKAKVDEPLTSLDGTVEPEQAAPARRGRKAKVAVVDETDAPQPTRKGRKKKAAAEED